MCCNEFMRVLSLHPIFRNARKTADFSRTYYKKSKKNASQQADRHFVTSDSGVQSRPSTLADQNS